MQQLGQQRRHRRLLQAAHPHGQVADLHGAGVGDMELADLGRARAFAQPRAVAVRAGAEGDHALDEGAHVRLHGVDVLGQHGFLQLRNQPLVGEVDAVDLDPGRLLVEQVVQFLLAELADRLVRIEEAAAAEDAAEPAVHAVAGNLQRAFVERPGLVVHLRQVEVRHRAAAFAARAHAAGAVEGFLHRSGFRAALDGDRTGRLHRGHVEGEGAGRADMRLAQAAEQNAQHGVGIGGGADGGARVRAHAFLVDHDGRGQAFEHVHVRARQRRHEALHEGAVGLVDQPLRFGGDGAEHQRALAGAGDAGEDGEAALGDGDADVLEVVDAGAVDADEVVGGGGWLGLAHRSSSKYRGVGWGEP